MRSCAFIVDNRFLAFGFAISYCGYRVEAPVIYEPDHGFRSLDGSAMEPESWLEIPLKPDRPLPFSCAVSPHCTS